MRRAIVLAGLLCGCQGRTELMVGLITDINAPAPLDVAHLRVFPNGDTSAMPKIDTFWTLEPGMDKLPGSFGLNSADGSGADVEIIVTGERPGGPNGDNIVFLTRRARLTFVSGKTLFMRMALVGACMNRTDCTDQQTCREGVCVDKMVDATTLPKFDPTGVQVTSVQCGASVFQDTSSHQQITGNGVVDTGGECGGGQCIEGTCYVPPQGNSGPAMFDGGSGGKVCAVSPDQCASCNSMDAAQPGHNFCNMLCAQLQCAPGCCGGSSNATPDMGAGMFDASMGGGGKAMLMINPPVGPVPVGGNMQLQAIFFDTTGGQSDVTSQCQWQTSNPSIATVQSMGQLMPGMVHGVATGSVQIHALFPQMGVQATTGVTVQ
jgi:hypothetical protein